MKNEHIDELAEKLKDALGGSAVFRDPDILLSYAADETSDLTGSPDILVRPSAAAEVSTVLRLCSSYRVPVTPRGAGTGVTGGSVPVCGGVVMSLERLNAVVEIDEDNMVAVVEPAVITGRLQQEALARGLMYPPDPASLESCSIGGNVAENAGGPRAVKYGTTKDYVLGLECVLPDGSIITTGGKTVKNATGYNLTGIIIGSEGTLAVITKIYLKLIPAPRTTLDILMPFASIDEAVQGVTALFRSGILPAVIEFMEQDALALVSRYLESSMPFPDAGAHLLVQLDGDSADVLFNQLSVMAEQVSVNLEDIFVAQTSMQQQRLWKARRSIREAIEHESPVFLAEDCVVPRAEIPRFLREVKSFLSAQNLYSVMFGHAGDGNVHIDILKGDMDYGLWTELLPKLKKGIYRRAIDRGGDITGEHGIGCLRKSYLPMSIAPEAIELARRIKAAFDPLGILNPGKIL